MTASYFNGKALNSVDAKNRVSVPSSFRDTIAKRAGESCVLLGASESGDCLIGYDVNRAERLLAKIDERYVGDYSDAQAKALQDSFAVNEALNFDENGRIVLPADQKSIVGIERHALFLGMGDYFQVWNPHTFIAYRGAQTPIGRMVQAMLQTARP